MYIIWCVIIYDIYIISYHYTILRHKEQCTQHTDQCTTVNGHGRNTTASPPRRLWEAPKGSIPPPPPNDCELTIHTDASSTTRCWRKGSKIHSQNLPRNHTPGASSHISTTSLANRTYGQTGGPETQIRRIAFGQQKYLKLLKHFRCSSHVDLFTNSKNRTG